MFGRCTHFSGKHCYATGEQSSKPSQLAISEEARKAAFDRNRNKRINAIIFKKSISLDSDSESDESSNDSETETESTESDTGFSSDESSDGETILFVTQCYALEIIL